MSEWKQANIPDMGPIITQYCRDINTKLEDNLMLTVEKAVGFHVDKDRLLQALTDAHAFYAEGYRAAMRRSEWISVKERFPQEYGAICENVILLMDDGFVTVGWLNQVTDRGYYLDSYNDVVVRAPLSRFTHWMPLPEPPKEG